MVEQTGAKLRQARIDEVVFYAQQKLDALPSCSVKEKELIIKFIRRYFNNVAFEDLAEHDVSDLYGAVITQWQMMLKHKPGCFKVNVYNPKFEDVGWESSHTIVEVLSSDMPFLVDSLRMAINRYKCNVHLIIHMGGVKVTRDSKGNLIDLLPYDAIGKNVYQEAPIYFEIDRQDDEKILESIRKDLFSVLQDIKRAYDDWEDMKKLLLKANIELQKRTGIIEKAELEEVDAFNKWIVKDNFTFLGAREYQISGKGKAKSLNLVSGSGLGVLKDENRSAKKRYFADLPTAGRYEVLSQVPVLISKSSLQSMIHRPAYTDCITVKKFDSKGAIVGQYQFLGLFTSTAYSISVQDIPILRRKVKLILEKSQLPSSSHAAKKLLFTIETLPRDDVFQAPWDELYDLAMGILQIQERQKVRLFIRKDSYGRYFSCFVYVPRENFSTKLVRQMEEILKETFNAEEISVWTYFSESVLARIHFFIRVNPELPIDYNIEILEQQITEVARSWSDELRAHLVDYCGEHKGLELFNQYAKGFQASYSEVFSPRIAAFDIQYMSQLSDKNSISMSFYRPVGGYDYSVRLKLYCFQKGAELSETLPILENMGLHIIDERPFEITTRDNKTIYIHDYNMYFTRKTSFEIDDIRAIFQEAFTKIWFGEAENDGFNQLLIGTLLSWREIAMLRAYSRYFRQMGFTFSFDYIEQTLASNPAIAKLLVEQFITRFDPECLNRQEKTDKIEKRINKLLQHVKNLDDDRILRQYYKVIRATLRTNYFQTINGNGSRQKHKPYLSLKIDSKRIPDMPLPHPMFEVFVYSPRFEGVHLRMDKVARGGIRWSDRREDFRREILDLMKAQQVKNALIVPEGAKGGFFPKLLADFNRRESIQKEAISCYKNFIRGLLDLTENLVNGDVISPDNTVRYDDDDYYLVVAADKGTATFSDIANQVASEYNFWLDDAFASGGSTGFDHKKMGITARGGWESVKSHFQDIGLNTQTTDFTVVGIGDMSGDVFGNGMLLSKHIKLVGAFNHRHIFIDPDPKPRVSFEERQRLFNLPRSGWDDYDPGLISKGGGVFDRLAKSINLTPEIKELTGLDVDCIEPNELIRALLKLDCDLIWNGGIGTYVKASTERNSEVGDRGNYSLRVNGNELRCRVVGEGGNLGFTQLGRIEYELSGGKINTDFVDNSAGVDCSDHEVNIKILLNQVESKGDITRIQRNKLLADMIDDVGELVLRNNYQQARALTLASVKSMDYLDLYSRFMDTYERSGHINRAISFLPDEKIIQERKSEGIGLTRPELAVLFAHNKIILKEELLKCKLIDQPFFRKYVERIMPDMLKKKYSEEMRHHRLRREIIATQLSNRIVTDMGATFVHQTEDEIGASKSMIVCAYIIAASIFDLSSMLDSINKLDHKIDPNVQIEMRESAIQLVRRTSRWLLHNPSLVKSVEDAIDLFKSKISMLDKSLPTLIHGDEKHFYVMKKRNLLKLEVPEKLAVKIALSSAYYGLLNVIAAVDETDTDLKEAAKCYFVLSEKLNLTWFKQQIDSVAAANRWSILAKAAYKANLDWKQKSLTVGALTMAPDLPLKKRMDVWFDKHITNVSRWEKVLGEMRTSNVLEFPMFAVAMQELMDLVQRCLDESKAKVTHEFFEHIDEGDDSGGN